MLKNKVVMITGASRGLGKALAYAFADAGAKLAIVARGAKKLEEVKKELEQKGAEVLAMTGDMSDPSDVERFVATTEATFGHIDVLINNASIFGPSPAPYLLDYPEE